MVATDAPSAYSSSIAIFYIASEHFSVEVLQTYGEIAVSFHLSLGDQWWFIVRCYLAPDHTSTIEDVVAAIS